MIEFNLTEKRTCILEVLTPTHVGSGDVWRLNLDYFLDEREILVIDQGDLYKKLASVPQGSGGSAIDTLTKYLSNNKDHWKIEQLIREENIDLAEIAFLNFEYPETGEPAREIRPLIRTGMGQTYIPGSSIKGAISNALINYLFHLKGLKPDNFKGKARSSYQGASGDNIDIFKELLGKFEGAITRYIRPSDILLSRSEIVNLELFNLYGQDMKWYSGYKNQLLSLEVFPVGVKKEFRLAIDNGLVKKVKEFNAPQLHENTDHVIKEEQPFQFLFTAINDATSRHVSREISFFKEYYQAEGTDQIIDQLDTLLQQTRDSQNSCILRLAFGSGFHSITGEWQFENHSNTGIWGGGKNKGKKKYKSRKIADYGDLQPMGFVKISLVGEDGRPDIKKDDAKTETSAPSKLLESKVVPKPPAISEQDFNTLKKGAIIQAEILKIDKPFCTVRLFLKNYPFEPVVQMSGSKKANIETGQIINVSINSQRKSGEIKIVKFQS